MSFLGNITESLSPFGSSLGSGVGKIIPDSALINVFGDMALGMASGDQDQQGAPNQLRPMDNFQQMNAMLNQGPMINSGYFGNPGGFSGTGGNFSQVDPRTQLKQLFSMKTY